MSRRPREVLLIMEVINYPVGIDENINMRKKVRERASATNYFNPLVR
jgi:hypothetical protein